VERTPDSSKPAAIEERLRAASDAIQLAVAQLRSLEQQKRNVIPSDARFVELAALVKSSSKHLLELATQEEAFAIELSRTSVNASLASIEEVQPRQDLGQILDEWREVERQLEQRGPSSPEAKELVARFERLRSEYSLAQKDKRAKETETS
jgi:hypothetical protein